MNTHRNTTAFVSFVTWCFGFVGAIEAQLVIPGADDSDLAFAPNANTVIDLAQAANGAWDTPSSVPGAGVYDPEMWAVVFKYDSVNIPSGVTVSFANHPTRAPVVWLVSGNVTIDGTVTLDGAPANQTTIPQPGPGGFRGGGPHLSDANPGSAGFGPGGARFPEGAGSYGTRGGGDSGPVYGNPSIIPLIGGSGGSIRSTGFGNCFAWADPGAGGGAILIACGGSLVINGQIRANGGEPTGACFDLGSGGSGGAIRLIADTVLGSGTLRAQGGAKSGGDSRFTGGSGRIRIEANAIALADIGDPQFVPSFPNEPVLLWPESDSPRVVISEIGTSAVPLDPTASFGFPTDVGISDTDPVTIRIETFNVPSDWQVEVRVVPVVGTGFVEIAVLVDDTDEPAIWESTATLPAGIASVQARAFATGP